MRFPDQLTEIGLSPASSVNFDDTVGTFYHEIFNPCVL